jgi:S-layer family protein
MKKQLLPRSIRLALGILLLAAMVVPQRSVRAAPSAPVNSNFEQGRNVGWQESSTNGFAIVWNPSAHNGFPAPAHGGSWIAYLGDENNEVSRVWQNLTLAPNTHVNFWYWLNSEDSCGNDFGYVFFNSTIIQSWDLCNSTGGWVQGTLDLSAYAGQTADFEFRTTSNATLFSGMLIDDVVFYDTFTDVLLSDPFLPYIKSLANAGITSGCSTTPVMYCPSVAVNRAQMAVFLERGIHGSAYVPPAVGASTGFSDVAISYWAAAWIKQLAAEGITGGCGTGTYCPESAVTRAQMAIFLLRAKHGTSYSPPAVGGSTGFTDVPPTYWAAAWIKQLAAEGITGGCGTGTYCPESPVTRGQMAVFLVRTFSLP